MNYLEQKKPGKVYIKETNEIRHLYTHIHTDMYRQTQTLTFHTHTHVHTCAHTMKVQMRGKLLKTDGYG